MLFKVLVKRQIEKVAFRNLIEKPQRGQKGRLLKYKKLELADYLLPECEVTLEERGEIFSVRTELEDFPCNFGNKTNCDMECKEVLNSEHLLTCVEINKEDTILKSEIILKGTMKQKV